MSDPFVSGWSPALEVDARGRFAASGRSLSTLPQFADDLRPLPRGYSLSGLLKWPYDQGYVGSCFSNMMAAVLQLMMAATIAAGFAGTLFNPSRRLIWYRCRRLDGSLGSRQDGGSIVHSFAAIGPAPDGIGDCTEELWPYRPDHDWLEQSPPASVVEAAGPTRLAHIADLDHGADFTPFFRAIYNGTPAGLGIAWYSGCSGGRTDASGRVTGWGGYLGEHAVAAIGYLRDWDGRDWVEILNSHGKVYPPLPPEVASLVEGYSPSGFTFWIRADMLGQLLDGRTGVAMIAGDVSGFTKKEITIAEGLSW